MAKIHASITPEIREWITRQPIFFVATAPLTSDGHINCSPKSSDTFRILGDLEAAYLDLTGSGAETIAHLQENGRIVIMFCAFSGPPQIVRLHGRGEVVYPDQPQFQKLAAAFPPNPGARAVIRIQVSRVSDSCGYSVPLMEFQAHRDVLDKWSERKGANGLIDYRREKNATSIDGLPGYRSPQS